MWGNDGRHVISYACALSRILIDKVLSIFVVIQTAVLVCSVRHSYGMLVPIGIKNLFVFCTLRGIDAYGFGEVDSSRGSVPVYDFPGTVK